MDKGGRALAVARGMLMIDRRPIRRNIDRVAVETGIFRVFFLGFGLMSICLETFFP